MTPLLQLENLSVSFKTPQGVVQAVREVSLTLNQGEILAIVGESGCGKTVMCKSVMRLLPNNAQIQGKILVEGKDLSTVSDRKIRRLSGTLFSMIFQDPMASLNPTLPVGKQIVEAILTHENISYQMAIQKTIELLTLVGIDNAEQRYKLQPHFFSGGMRQRCILAIALALNPKILFADEPTTSLDVTVQASILDLLIDIKNKTGISIVFITHDLGVVARIATRVAVMYAGKIVEVGTTDEVFYDPRHPYTWGLLSSHPSLAVKFGELKSIPGMPPDLLSPPIGDAFACRNPVAMKIDFLKPPPMFRITETHHAATWLLDERAPAIQPPTQIKRQK